MNDIELTKACAEAMNIPYQMGLDRYSGEEFVNRLRFADCPTSETIGAYDPLHDDAQAMALVKTVRLAISTLRVGGWMVNNHKTGWVENTDLNRAICECVAALREREGEG